MLILSTDIFLYLHHKIKISIMGCKYNHISFGDKIHVKLIVNNNTIREFTLSNITSLSELTNYIHIISQNIHGLYTLLIRNMSQGWTTKRHIMLYKSKISKTEFTKQNQTNQFNHLNYAFNA